MTRYKLTIEYDGTPFVGWQRQTEGPSVQEAIETAVFKFSGERVTLHAAGRTDAGVHALAQVAHLDLEKIAPPFRIMEAVNFHLKPNPVAILDCAPVPAEFHARFSAVERRYRYRIVNRRAPLTWDKGLSWQVAKPLDADAMHTAAQLLVGLHDFTTFRSAHCQSDSPLKTLDRLDVARDGDEIIVTAAARSFLHHQVRSMVGSLTLVGRGKWTLADMASALAAADRQRLGLNAPPDGLYFIAAHY